LILKILPMTRRAILVATIFLITGYTHAQEQLGIRTSNYGGVNALTLNPAAGLTSPFRWDVNLVEFGQFFDNNYLFIENFRLLDVLNLPSKGALRPELERKDLPTPPDRFVVDFYRSTGADFTFRGDVFTQVLGPSLMLKLGDATTVGFYTRVRGSVSTRRLPGILGYYEFTQELYDSSFTVQAFKLSGMAWSELGLNYARTGETDNGQISIGGTLKWLQGYEAGFGSMEQPMRFREIPGGRLLGEQGSTQHFFTIPSLNGWEWQPKRKGSGLAVDLGLVYTISEAEDTYRWRFGFSLLDVGAVHFTKQAERHRVVVTDSTSLFFREFEQFKNVEQLDSIARLFSRQTMKDPYASLQGRSFSIWLPAAFSAQADFAVTPSFFLNASLVQGIPFTKNMLRRSSVAALTPRFENRWLEAALPITLLNWQRVRTGLAARLAFFWFGTEDLGSVFGRSDFDSTDFYFAIKVNPFQFNSKKEEKQRSGWKGHRQPKTKSVGRSKVRCPNF